MAAKIRKGDRVQVLTGKDKGRQGEVIRVNPTEGRAFVQGIVSAADDNTSVEAQVRRAAIRVVTMKVDQGLVPCR